VTLATYILANAAPNSEGLPLVIICLFVIPPITGAIFAYRAKEKKVATFFFATFIAFIIMNIVLEIAGKII
jgi:hypothetical protein